MSSVSDPSGDGTSTARARAGCWDGGGRSREGHMGSRVGDAGFPDGCSSIGRGALGLNGSTRGSSLDFVAGITGDTNPERHMSLKRLFVSHRSFSTSGTPASSFLWHTEAHITHKVTENLLWTTWGSNTLSSHMRQHRHLSASCPTRSYYDTDRYCAKSTVRMAGQTQFCASDKPSEMNRC